MQPLTGELKAYARDIGFHLVGVASPEPFAEAEQAMTRWLAAGHQGEMAWMTEARARLACRPEELLAGARSLVVVGVSYRTAEPDPKQVGRVARYAWGSDYHDALKARLKSLAAFLEGRSPGARTRAFVDSGPLAERDAALRAGLGFRGKNTNLLTPIGSFVFLGALLTDVALTPDEPVIKDCGTCRRCLDACPTGALDEAYHLAAERCIAYLTIEHRGPMPEDLRPLTGNWLFGCDICQDVCPYNASARGKPRGWAEFEPRQRITPEALLAMDPAEFSQAARGSPMKRAKRGGLARNAAVVLGNSGDARHRPALEHAAHEHDEAVVREAAEWALRQLPSPTSE